jgi:hypothetical protein
MLKIRPFEWKDAEALNERANDPRVCKYLVISPPISMESTVEYFAKKLEAKDIVFVAEYDNKVAGSIEIGRKGGKFSHVGDMGIAIKKEYWGKGIGTRLFEQAVKEAKRKRFKKLTYCVFEPNKRSIKLVKEFGFKLAGRLGKQVKIGNKYHDELIFEKLL